jgi:hypothetical protein
MVSAVGARGEAVGAAAVGAFVGGVNICGADDEFGAVFSTLDAATGEAVGAMVVAFTPGETVGGAADELGAITLCTVGTGGPQPEHMSSSKQSFPATLAGVLLQSNV